MTPSLSLTLVVCLCTLWATLRAEPRAAAGRAVSGTLVLATLVPVTSILDDLAVFATLSTIVIACVIALVRHPPSARRIAPWGSILFALFLAWLITRIVGEFTPRATLLQVGMLVSVAALAMVVPRLTTDDLPVIANVFLVLVLVHSAYAFLEQTGTVGAFWELREKSLETIDDRQNVLAGWLTGRSQSTFGHPIPFAVFACVARVVLLHAALQTRRWRYSGGILVCVAALILSGTRSAIVALLAALAAYMLANVRWRRLLPLLALSGVLAIAALVVDLPRLLALDERFESSVSFIHRNLVLNSWNALWARDDATRWFGSGAGATQELFRSGVVRGASSLVFFDNTYISLFALSGLVAVILFCAVLGWSLRGGALAIAVAAFIAVMGGSFDEQVWPLPLVLLAFGSLLPRPFGTIERSRPRDVQSEDTDRLAATTEIA